MKKIIIALCLGFSMSVYAQNAEDTVIRQIIEEDYLVNLFQNADVIYCKVDDVDDYIAVKNMEVSFYVDSALFLTAFIESNQYEKKNTSCMLWCTYVELNDSSGHMLKIAYQTPASPLKDDEDPLNDLDALKLILDSLLQKTALVDYSKDTRIFLDIHQD
ncbi:MAG: hypothetical protein WC010_01725 [Candidatus Absconditabacterales bacterium]